MLLYDVLGILFLIFTGSLFIFLPLAAAASLAWVFQKVKWFFQTRRTNIRQGRDLQRQGC